MTTWDELSKDDQDLNLYSDMYKDANGFRPRGSIEWFLALSQEERQAEFKRLSDEITRHINDEKIDDEKAAEARYVTDADAAEHKAVVVKLCTVQPLKASLGELLKVKLAESLK